VADFTRNGRENDAIGERLTAWSCALLAERDESQLPERVVAELKEAFAVPAAAIRIWDFAPRFAGLECTTPVGADLVRFAASMRAPFCGPNADFAAASCCRQTPRTRAAMALIPCVPTRPERRSGFLRWVPPIRSVSQRHGHRVSGPDRTAGRRCAVPVAPMT